MLLCERSLRMNNEKMFFSVVTEHKALTDFYLSAGLEISDGWEKESGVFFSEAVFYRNKYKMSCKKESEGDGRHRCDSFHDCDNTVAAYSISKRYGVTVLDYIAVKDSLRKSGIGRKLLDRIREKCRKDGVDKIYLTAKAKGFFKKSGARELSASEPLFKSLLGECAECTQREKDCFPAVMVIDLQCSK